jgi:hypothetical protein
MKWTLLVPGALLPDHAPRELADAIRAPDLARRLATAREAPSLRAAEHCTGAAHVSWLAHALQLGDNPPATAAYAWRSLAPGALFGLEASEAGTDDAPWIAQCEPVHIEVGRDRLVLSDLAAAPLEDAEAVELIDLANEAARARSAEDANPRGWRFERRAGRWFLLAQRPLEVQGWPLDAVRHGSIRDRQPSGADARALRVLANDVQMSWHECAANDAREARGLPAANGLWIHGGGSWQPVAPAGLCLLRVADAPDEADALRGWLLAGAGRDREVHDPAAWCLSLCRELFDAFARRDWQEWLARLPACEARIEYEIREASQRETPAIELVLCGAREARSFTVPLHGTRTTRRPAVDGWRRWPLLRGAAARADAAGLRRRLFELE